LVAPAPSELLQHLFLQLLDLAANVVDPVERPAEPLGFFHDLIDLGQNVSKLGVKFDERPCALVAGFAWLRR
jgi:hypothetical protein